MHGSWKEWTGQPQTRPRLLVPSTISQLECAQLDTCFFMIFTEKDFYIEKMDRDPGFWTEKIFPKLKGFLMDALIPEFHRGFQYENRTYKINRLVPVTGKFIFLTFYPSL